MKKENIIIVEALSAGVNYIHDIREIGHNPIVLEMYQEDDKRDAARKMRDEMYSLNNEEAPQILIADKDYERTLDMVRELNPLAIIPGSDSGIIWATKLAYDLGLPGNDPKNLNKMIDKQYMQDALKEAGIRYIKSQFISSYEEAKEFISHLDKPQVVIKPSIGQGTIGVCICKNDDELKDAMGFTENISFDIARDEDDKIVIQEFIEGKEYVINTVCCKGHNRPISAYYYDKILIEGRGPIYNFEEAIDESDSHFKELVEYNEKVISALGIEYGSIHGEYMLDENGPVLIEMNCRVPGPFQKYTLIDSVWGEHSTTSSLESYVNPEKCIKKTNKPLKCLTHYIIKYIIIYDEIDVIKPTFEEAFNDIESIVYTTSIFDKNHLYTKTIDLITSGGFVFLTNNNREKLFEDLNEIIRMEKYEVEKMYDMK